MSLARECPTCALCSADRGSAENRRGRGVSSAAAPSTGELRSMVLQIGPFVAGLVRGLAHHEPPLKIAHARYRRLVIVAGLRPREVGVAGPARHPVREKPETLDHPAFSCLGSLQLGTGLPHELLESRE